MVVAAVLASAGRAHPTELLLCGHHYRASMAALAAVRATVLDFDGTPVTDEAWHLTSAA